MFSMDTTTEPPPLLALPSELIHHILSFLSWQDLLATGLTSRALHSHSQQDSLYQRFVQENTPDSLIRKPAHLSWRELFILHHPYWFIPRNKIWFADNAHTGKLLIARYDHRINAIEAYALVAERRQPAFQTWEWNPDAIIHTFNPRIQLDLNQPVVRLDAYGYENSDRSIQNRLQREIQMNLSNESPRASAGICSSLMLARPWPADITTTATPIWPPLTLPSPIRSRSDSFTNFRSIGNRPSAISEMSTATFRMRMWMEFSSRQHPGMVRAGEGVTTWATLPEECYTPTPQKPWQGIWCGDYAGHGCEFLAIMQPDDPKPLPERAEWVVRAREREGSVSSAGSWSTAPTDATEDEQESVEDEAWNSSDEVTSLEDSAATLKTGNIDSRPSSPEPVSPVTDETMYSGRIEAVKLTGDPNIPRGEYTFIAPDIGPNGLIRVATEDMFKGARIVKSVGHIAARGFREDDYLASQLILISHDRLAQYWEPFGHVSFYQRVNIEEFTNIP
ncbi:F-box domain-containing protein [Periconia macrospinosa]|uniref:F-box domain-containing protein n=1 Tax=Periconia macrospinosa TaxID=97972 RepID=A0A2V1DF11_9PLEO|nr:F-box domain-containing protein [Periconia macrospinosa]